MFRKILIAPMHVLALVFFFFGGTGLVIHKAAAQESGGKTVQLIQAGELEVVKIDGVEKRYVKSSATKNVIFRQGGMTLYCIQAIHYTTENKIQATGNVLIEQGDSVTITGDSLIYDGNSKQGEIWGEEVVMKEDSVTLITDRAKFNRNTSLAWYETGGVVYDDSTVLNSLKGYYDGRTKVMGFKTDVHVDNNLKNHHLTSDTLTYDTRTKDIIFSDTTLIRSKDKALIANKGKYYTQLGYSDLENQSSMETQKFMLFGDKIKYDEESENGQAYSNVRMYSKKDTVSIFGQVSHYVGSKGYSKVYGDALMHKPMDSDTLLLTADTLISINDTINKRRLMKAYYNVKIASRKMHGICDSLVYNYDDSTIWMFYDPVLWTSGNQMTADTIRMTMKGSALDKLYLDRKAFAISEDSLMNYNQIKGRNMVVYFEDNYLDQIHVNGNGENIYFALEGDTVLMGMNKVECSNMILSFLDSNKLNTMTFIKKPEAKFIPPHELEDPEKRLKGFKWRQDERPSEDSLFTLLGTYLSHLPPLKFLIALEDTSFTKQNTDSVVLQRDDEFRLELENDTLFFVLRECSSRKFEGYFYADFIPENREDLPKKDRKQKYASAYFIIEESQCAEGEVRFGVPLPTYPLFTIRAGQFNVNGPRMKIEKARKAKQKFYYWTDYINLY